MHGIHSNLEASFGGSAVTASAAETFHWRMLDIRSQGKQRIWKHHEHQPEHVRSWSGMWSPHPDVRFPSCHMHGMQCYPCSRWKHQLSVHSSFKGRHCPLECRSGNKCVDNCIVKWLALEARLVHNDQVTSSSRRAFLSAFFIDLWCRNPQA